MKCKYKGYLIFVARGKTNIIYQILKDKFWYENVISNDVSILQMMKNCKDIVDQIILTKQNPYHEQAIPYKGM